MADVAAAAGWGLLAGSALLVGAAVGWLADLSEWLVATIMAFGAGVLISAVSFELIDEAWQTGGLTATAAGAFVGAIAFAGADWLLTRAGMRQPKRMEAAAGGGSGTTIAVGALLDGLPESFVIGVSMLGGTRVSLATVVAIFVSNLPEGLASSVAMRRAGRRATFVFGIWAAIALAGAVAAGLGLAVAEQVRPEVLAAITGLAAGAVLAMVADTMIPEAYEIDRAATGLLTVLGFLAAFALSKGA